MTEHSAVPSLVFQNPGLIDLEAVKILGVCSKDTDNPIGYFGTGLKYAISILLRNRQKIVLYRGFEKYEFGVRNAKIRNDHFNIVTMNGEDMGFTTDLGKNWELWMAYRELHCNVLDERGTVTVSLGLEVEKDKTTIIVTGREILDVYHKRDAYFITTEPIYTEDEISVHPKSLGDPEDDTLFFMRGILVYQRSTKSKYRYNILKTLALTEDRMLKWGYEAGELLTKAIYVSKNRMFIRDMVTTRTRGFEQFVSSNDPSTSTKRDLSWAFKKEVHDLLLDSKHVNPTVKDVYQEHIHKTVAPIEYKLCSVQQMALERALLMCTELGFQSILDYDLKIVETLGPSVLGKADMETKTILIASMAFNQGIKILAGTLIEEYIHLKHDVYDCSREMQNLLIDMLITVGETHILKEPL